MGPPMGRDESFLCRATHNAPWWGSGPEPNKLETLC